MIALNFLLPPLPLFRLPCRGVVAKNQRGASPNSEERLPCCNNGSQMGLRVPLEAGYAKVLVGYEKVVQEYFECLHNEILT